MDRVEQMDRMDRMEQAVQYYKDAIESKDDSVSFIDSANDLFGFNGTEIKRDKYEKIFQKFQVEKGKSNNIIDAFDNWLTEILPNQVLNQKKDLENGVVMYFTNVKIYKPYMYGDANGKKYQGLPDSMENIVPMYPIDAIMRQETYEAEIRVDIYTKNTTGDNIFDNRLLSKDQILGRIPIIKGCKYCWLRDMTDSEKISVGECFNDPLGYFVIGGMEKAMIGKESVRTGTMLIAKWDKNSAFNSILMYSPTTKTQIRMKLGINSKNNNSFEAEFNSKAPSPVFILSLFLQYLHDPSLQDLSKNMEGMMSTCKTLIEKVLLPEILDHVKPNEKQMIRSILISSIVICLSEIEEKIVSITAKNGSDEINPIEVFTLIIDTKKKDIKYTRKFSNFIDEIKMNVFPTNADDLILANLTNDFDRRRKMLSMMIATYARHIGGFRMEDNRDSYMIKKIDTVAKHLENSFNPILSKIVEESSIRSQIKHENFTRKFLSKTKGSTASTTRRENFLEPLKRMTPSENYSHIRAVTIAENKTRDPTIRNIQPSQVGYICTGETASGQNIGILKNITALCWISIPRDRDIVEDIIAPFIDESKESDNHVSFLLNGNIVGWILSSRFSELRRLIKTNILTYDVTVYMNNMDSYVDVFTNGSIPTRPLLTINPETGLINLEELIDLERSDRSENGGAGSGATDATDVNEMSIDDLIINGFIEYNSPYELDNKIEASPGDEKWKSLNKNFQYIKIAEYVVDVKKLVEDQSQGKRLDEQPFTHSELVPYFQFGYAATCVPKGNLNKGPRITYQSSMFKQAISGYHSVHSGRYDTGFKLHQFPTRTMFETATHKPIGMNAMPTTATAVIAIFTRAKNNEDALVAKTEYLDNNLRYISYYTCSIPLTNDDTVDVRPEHENDPKFHALYKHSDNVSKDLIGFPKIGSFVDKGDAILSKYNERVNPEDGVKTYNKNPNTIGLAKEGYIVGVEVVKTQHNQRIVRVKIAQYRRQIIGDKVASRYSQKGTFGEVVPERDLPRIVGGPNDGVVPDLIFNPHSIPSRLTQGKILEILCTKASLYTGMRINASSFGEYENDDYMKDFEKILKDNGMEESGLEQMMHPDGTLMEAKIFVGACSYQILKHHVADKFQMRDGGRYEPLTHQPVRGKFKEGGQKVGEMERDALISHGTSRVVMDRMVNSSDLYRIVVCKKCGNIAISNFDPKETSCQYCPGASSYKDFGVMNIPYIAHLIIRMLNAAGIHIHFKF